MAHNGLPSAPVSKWERRKYTPGSKFSTERLDLILAKLKSTGSDDEEEVGEVVDGNYDIETNKETKGGTKSWNVYMHESPFEKNRSVFEDLVTKKSPGQKQSKSPALKSPKVEEHKPKTRLKSYDEFIKDHPQDNVTQKASDDRNNNDAKWIKPTDDNNATWNSKPAENNVCKWNKPANTKDCSWIKQVDSDANWIRPATEDSVLQKFAGDIDTVPTKDTAGLAPAESFPASANDDMTKSDSASITSSGNDATKDNHHNDSGFLDELSSTEAGGDRKAVSFSIDHHGFVAGEVKAETLPRRRNTRPKEGFVNRAKSFWQKQSGPETGFDSCSLSSSRSDLSKKKSGSRVSLSDLHLQKKSQTPTRPITPVHYKDRFSSAKVKSAEEIASEKKYQDNTNAPPLSMQSANAFKIWKLREELDTKTREAESFVDHNETLRELRPTTPVATRSRTPTSNRSRTPTSSRSRTPTRSMTPGPMDSSSSRDSRDRTRRLPQVPAPSSRLLAPTISSEARKRATTPSATDRVRPTTPSADRIRPTTPSADRMHPTTPSGSSRVTSPTPSESGSTISSRRSRAVTPTRDYYSLPRTSREQRARQHAMQDSTSRVRPTTPNRELASANNTLSRETTNRAMTPSRQYERQKSAGADYRQRVPSTSSSSSRSRPVTPSRDYKRVASPVAFGSRVPPKQEEPPNWNRNRTKSQPDLRGRALSPTDNKTSHPSRVLSPTISERIRELSDLSTLDDEIEAETRSRARYTSPNKGEAGTSPRGKQAAPAPVERKHRRVRPTTPTREAGGAVGHGDGSPRTPPTNTHSRPRSRPTTPTSTEAKNKETHAANSSLFIRKSERVLPQVPYKDGMFSSDTDTGDGEIIPVAPPRRYRKNLKLGGRTLPPVPQHATERSRSPGLGRPISPGLARTRARTPTRDTNVAGEGEAEEEGLTLNVNTLSMGSPPLDTSSMLSPGSCNTDEIGGEIQSSLRGKSVENTMNHVSSSDETNNTSSTARIPQKEKQISKEPTASEMLSKMLDASRSRAFSPPPISPEYTHRAFSPPPTSSVHPKISNLCKSSQYNRPFSPPPVSPTGTETEKVSVEYQRPVTPSRLRAMTPTRSILKKTPSRNRLPSDDSENSVNTKTESSPAVAKTLQNNAGSSQRDNRSTQSAMRLRDPSPRRSTWSRSRVGLRSNLDKKASPSFENLGKSLMQSLAPSGVFGEKSDHADDNDDNKQEQDKHKRESPRKTRDRLRRNTIEGIPNMNTLSTSTLTLPHRRTDSRQRDSTTVRWDPSSFKSNSLGRGMSRSTQDLRAALGSSREDLRTRSKSPTADLRAPSIGSFGGSSVSSRFRRFESMDALEMYETGSTNRLDLVGDEDDSEMVKFEFFV